MLTITVPRDPSQGPSRPEVPLVSGRGIGSRAWKDRQPARLEAGASGPFGRDSKGGLRGCPHRRPAATCGNIPKGPMAGKEIFSGPLEKVIDFMVDNDSWIVGTPDDCVHAINRLAEQSGGFGGFPGADGRLGAAGKRCCAVTSCWPATLCPSFKARRRAPRLPTVGRQTGKTSW